MKAINYACFKLEKKKAIRGVKKNKNNYINLVGEKNAMTRTYPGIIWAKRGVEGITTLQNSDNIWCHNEI